MTKKDYIYFAIITFLVLALCGVLYVLYDNSQKQRAVRTEYLQHVEQMNQFRQRMERFGVQIPPQPSEIDPTTGKMPEGR